MGVRSLRSSITLSLVFHFLLIGAFALLWSQQARKLQSKRDFTWIEVDPASSRRDLKKAKENLQSKNQIVQTERGKQVQVAPMNAYLGEKNQVVDRESVSANRSTEMAHEASSRAPRAQPKNESKPQTKAPVLSDLGATILPRAQPQKTTPAEEQVAHEENWADQSKAPQDYVRGLRESNRTALNTKEYVFYGYYQRIRERLDRAWVPILRSKLTQYYYSGRHLASEMDHSTKVVVVLDVSGEIRGVRVVSESGTQDLDEAAVAAFNQAGPFPNPPRGIAGADGLIEIPWEFILRT